MATSSGYVDAKGQSIFSKAFAAAHEAAERKADTTHSAAPIAALLDVFKRPEEVAEIELTLGIAYGQRTGIADPKLAIEHFSKALEFELPEGTAVQTLVWRGNAYEQTKSWEPALTDYLRALLVCTDYDLPAKVPEPGEPAVTLLMNGHDAVNLQNIADYNAYRRRIRQVRDLVIARWDLVDAVKRVMPIAGGSDAAKKSLARLSPSSYRVDRVMKRITAATNPDPRE